MEETGGGHLPDSQSATPFTWCIEALSIMTTERGFTLLKGCKTGKRELRTNSSNLSPFTEPSIRLTS